jgi:hypothetical protein
MTSTVLLILSLYCFSRASENDYRKNNIAVSITASY